MKLDAILWDYDGTIVNSVPKNIDITKRILSIVAPHLSGDNLPQCLHSEAAYHQVNHAAKNWQELYVKYYGMTEAEMLQAGTMWADHQLTNTTPVTLFEGMKDTVKHLSDIPHGICSQNAAMNIKGVLSEAQVDTYFKAVIGYDDVSTGGQKPSPEGGVKCLKRLFGKPDGKVIMYVGDHEADVKFARNLQLELGQHSTVISVAAAYSGALPDTWQAQPDFVIRSPFELTAICEPYL
ncbi:HAD family hydrolase [Photobacterium rosenbergii]|uniref:HAD family hydrolase n=1 Tax=Photobacterium rosenbergii TaxID=294936 RepID=UPI001C994F94|nr:HAD-IA family hydrolase [Photobacterium rosenbergii]MBY5946826.1 HAD-IA family hydrolase [Photobacterium rosenbergii]